VHIPLTSSKVLYDYSLNILEKSIKIGVVIGPLEMWMNHQNLKFSRLSRANLMASVVDKVYNHQERQQTSTG